MNATYSTKAIIKYACKHTQTHTQVCVVCYDFRLSRWSRSCLYDLSQQSVLTEKPLNSLSLSHTPIWVIKCCLVCAITVGKQQAVV